MASLATATESGLASQSNDEVYIGIPTTKIPVAAADTADPYLSKIGGFPSYFSKCTNADVGNPKKWNCGECAAELSLVAQVYAPLDFVRSVLVFGCNATGCPNRNSPKAWRVVRIQNRKDLNPWNFSEKIPKEQAKGKAVVPAKTSDRADGEHCKSERAELPVVQSPADEDDFEALFAVRDMSLAKKKEAKESAAKPKKKKKGPAKPPPPSAKSPAKVSAGGSKESNSLPTFPIDVVDEPFQNFAPARDIKKYKKFIDSPFKAYTYGEEDEGDGDDSFGLGKWGKKASEKGKGSRKHGRKRNSGAGAEKASSEFALKESDSLLVEFQQRVLREPRQCIRYGYGTTPLWPCRPPSSFTVPRCPCGAQRKFEMQLTPGLLSLVEEQNDMLAMDWVTVMVFSCEQSCDQSFEEVVYVVKGDVEGEKIIQKLNSIK